MRKETKRLVWIAVALVVVLAAMLAVDAALISSNWVSSEMMMEMLG